MSDASRRATRRAAVRLMASGVLSPAEAAQVAGVSRATTYRWAAEAGIQPEQARAAYVAREWSRATTPRGRKPTRAETDARTAEQVTRYVEGGGRIRRE